MSKQAVSMYERGEREPSIDTLHKMCEVFEVDMDTLCGRLNEKTPPEEPKLSEGEEELLKLIRLMPSDMKALYLETLRATLKGIGLI
jgi:transcriptional regulator with XRE-family HTH domain